MNTPRANEFAHESHCTAVTWLHRHDPRVNTSSRECQITDAVESLVPHELVRPAQRTVDDTVVVENHCVRRRCAANQSLRAQHLDLAHEAECPRARQLRLERLLRHADPLRFPAVSAVLTLDRHIELETVCGKRLVDRLTIDYANGLRQHENLRMPLESRKAGVAQCLEERCGAPVQNRWLGAVHLDDDVIYLERRDSRENVLDCMKGVWPRAQLCSALARADLIDSRRNRRQARRVDSAKCYPLSCGRRPEGKPARLPKMKTDSLDGRRLSNRVAAQVSFRSPSSFSRRDIMPPSRNSAAVALSDSR